jgi:hypothetical protein
MQLANKNKPVEADVDATETEDEDGEDLELDAIPLGKLMHFWPFSILLSVEKEQYNLLKEGMKVDKMIGMTKLNGKKMALVNFSPINFQH